MIFAAAMKDFGTVMRGDPVEFQLACLVGGGDALQNYIPPEGSTIKAAVQKADKTGNLEAYEVTVVNQYGYMLIKFSKEQTLLMSLGQPVLVVVCEKDGYKQTFQTRLPFVLLDTQFRV